MQLTTPYHDTLPEQSADSGQNLKKAARASFIGNFVEWFDYGAYGYLAAVIATVFFPTGDKTTDGTGNRDQCDEDVGAVQHGVNRKPWRAAP